VSVQLFFEGGPWANQLLESEVTQAPEFLAPDDEAPGTYRRVERPGSSAAAYEWVPEGRDPSHRFPPVSAQLGIEAVAAFAALVLAVVTAFSDAWIEAFGVDPDHRSGASEWAVVFALLAISIGLTLAARHEWRRLTAART
jgi:hypothetical protein